MEQLACFLTPVNGNSIDGYGWEITEEIEADGVSFSGAINRLPDGTNVPFAKDYEHGNDPESIVAAGLTVVYARGDETNIAVLESYPDYHLFWMTYTDHEQPDTIAEPTDLNVISDLSSLRDFISIHTLKTNEQILQWFGNKFEVTKAQAIAKATSENRMWLVQKMMVAMRRWSEAKAEFDALD